MSFENFDNYKKYQGKTILAIDLGTVVTGFALFTPGRDPMVLSAGRLVMDKKKEDLLYNHLDKIIADESVEIIVIGVPYFTDGKESEKTKEVKTRVEEIRVHYPRLAVLEQDETLTTEEAKDRMKNSALYNFKVDLTKIDEICAVIILEDFIRT